MATSTDPLARSSIGIQARGVGARMQGSDTNSALELAASLRSIEPAAGAALQGYADDQQKAQAAQARKDALETSGAKLADAVREGRIKPTQNPWYMQAYAREGAAIRAQRDFSDLSASAASWEQRNDPKAFEERWRAEAGAITENYGGVDELAGFSPVEAQFTQQALQSNLSQNTKRIETERVDNLTSLASSSLADLARANGGTLTATQAVNALQGAKEMWFGTGGDVGAWHDMVEGALTNAARKTNNAGLIDLLQDPRLIGGQNDDPEERVYGDGAKASSEVAPRQVPLPSADPAVPSPAEAPPAPVKGPERWSSEQLASTARSLIPGAKVTSMRRTEQHNREVGGVPNSQHVRGTAIDVVMPKGTTREQVLALYAGKGVQVDVIDEGDHFHIQGARQWKPSSTASASSGAPSTQPLSSVLSEGSTNQVSAASPQSATGPTPFPKGPSLYDMPGVGERAEQAKYYIARAAENAQGDRLKTLKKQVDTRAFEAVDYIYSTHGTAALKGEVSPDAIISELSAKGYSGQAIGAALSSLRQDVSASQGLSNAKFQSADPSASTALFALQVRGRTQGYSPAYEQEVAGKVMSGLLSREDGAAMVSASVSRTEQLNAGERRETTQAGAAGTIVTSVANLREITAPGLIAMAEAKLRENRIMVDPRLRPRMVANIRSVMMAHLATHPGDLEGAEDAGKRYVVRLVTVEAPARTKWKKGGGQGTKPVASQTSTGRPGGNPRG